MNGNFFIYKKSYLTEEKPDLSFIPMMTRRKLSHLSKIAFATLYKCYEQDEVNLVFASKYGEVDKLLDLIKQYTSENEVSPIAFSSSVHNSTIGTFSLLNKIKSKYDAVSAGDNSLSNGLLNSILNKSTTLFCYADTIPELQSVSCLLGESYQENADKIELIFETNNTQKNEYERFIKFLENTSPEFKAPFFTLRRMHD